MRDQSRNLSAAVSLVPSARTASANGTGVDLANFDSATIIISAGVLTDGTQTFEVQESDDNSTFTPVADVDLEDGDGDGVIEPALLLTDDNAVREIGYLGMKRYIRVVSTAAGTTTGGVFGAIVVRGHSKKKPV